MTLETEGGPVDVRSLPSLQLVVPCDSWRTMTNLRRCYDGYLNERSGARTGLKMMGKHRQDRSDGLTSRGHTPSKDQETKSNTEFIPLRMR